MKNLMIMKIMMESNSIIGIIFEILKTALLDGIQDGSTNFIRDKFMEFNQLKQHLDELKSNSKQQKGDE